MSKGGSFNFYGLLSGVSFLVRWIACYYTIGQIDIFENQFLNFVVPDGIIYFVLLLITYWTVGAIVYNKLEIHDKYVGCVAYFIAYFPYMLIVWGVLALLTWVNVLPIKI